jgi:hypothetical protein
MPFSAICDHTIAENGRKSQHNLSTGQKKVLKGQFLMTSRNWQKCSALGSRRLFFWANYLGLSLTSSSLSPDT